jgi:hypothetical protein
MLEEIQHDHITWEFQQLHPFRNRDLSIAYSNPFVSRWASMTPLQQFKGAPAEVIRKAEEKQFVSDDLLCMNIS